MGIASHAGVARAGASFELERLELDDGRLVVRGWWSGLRGVRFVRPGLVVDGRRVLATLEHKPWAADVDGSWTAAFPWKRGLDVDGVTLVVAPSVEVPLDRDAAPLAEEIEPELRKAGLIPSAPGTVVHDVTLRDELDGVERQLDAMHAQLREARADAAERDARCHELEQAVARERRAATAAQDADDEFVRSHAMAVLDRDRAMAQHAEAVNDREAAVRARTRMERQRDAALAATEAAQARRDEALAERDEARKQRDELLLAHQALQAQLKHEWVQASPLAPAVCADEPTRPLSAEPAAGEPTRPVRAESAVDEPTRPLRVESAADEPTRPLRVEDPAPPAAPGSFREKPIGVRTIPAARTVAASLHRSKRERDHAVTAYDMWAVRILGTVAALAFISLLAMILKAFFVF
ncbi:MAG: hypothetical protein QOJ46_981 [bacterium]|jgi:hypothetical protein